MTQSLSNYVDWKKAGLRIIGPTLLFEWTDSQRLLVHLSVSSLAFHSTLCFPRCSYNQHLIGASPMIWERGEGRENLHLADKKIKAEKWNALSCFRS